jgi:hypothetical protein
MSARARRSSAESERSSFASSPVKPMQPQINRGLRGLGDLFQRFGAQLLDRRLYLAADLPRPGDGAAQVCRGQARRGGFAGRRAPRSARRQSLPQKSPSPIIGSNGPLLNPTPAIRSSPRECVFMPLSRHWRSTVPSVLAAKNRSSTCDRFLFDDLMHGMHLLPKRGDQTRRAV